MNVDGFWYGYYDDCYSNLFENIDGQPLSGEASTAKTDAKVKRTYTIVRNPWIRMCCCCACKQKT